jgi:hypothetical protein
MGWRLGTVDKVDEKLLAAARQAQERLIETEHNAEVARAEFHLSVRRLHLHGSSLRELAAALGLSHQRVHQIVEAAGGSRRWGRRRISPASLSCSFCGKPQPETRKLIAGPAVFICETCAVQAASVITTGSAAQTPLGLIRAVPGAENRERCSFCGKHRQQLSGLAAMPADAGGKSTRHAAICAECLELCTEIIAEHL